MIQKRWKFTKYQKVFVKSTNRLSSLFRFKDAITKEVQPHRVYNFSCGNCSVTYYGKTECDLNVRSSEHIGISHLTGKRVECKPSAVSDLLLLYNHNSDFNNFTILCRDNNGFTAWKLSKYGVISGSYFPVVRPEITQCWGNFQAVFQTIIKRTYLNIYGFSGSIIIWLSCVITNGI